MRLLTLGLNHRTAPIDVRERVSFSREELRTGLQNLGDYDVVSGLVVLSTCNRTELYAAVEDLPVGARVGTSSLRRRAQLLAVRPDLTICDLRGNVNTRLAKLDAGEFDAIVLAAAGLKRLGFERRIRSILPRSVMLPAVGQGALAIECRAGDTEILSAITFLRDAGMTTAAQAERAFLRRVEGGCQIPVGVYAEVDADGQISIDAMIASVDGQRICRSDAHGAGEQAEALGTALAEELLDAGGREILKEIGITA